MCNVEVVGCARITRTYKVSIIRKKSIPTSKLTCCSHAVGLTWSHLLRAGNELLTVHTTLPGTVETATRPKSQRDNVE
jgi:hypothetical protein